MDNNKTYQYFALKYDDGESHSFYNHHMPFTGGLVCSRGDIVYEVILEETDEENQEYVGWRRTDKEEIDFIFKNKLLLTCCFPYGVENAIKAGKGQIVYLKEISFKKLTTAGSLKGFLESEK